MTFEIGQLIRSRRTFSLDGCIVDGETIFEEDWDDVPHVLFGQQFEVVSLLDGQVSLRNLDDRVVWEMCEFDEADLNNFAIIL